VAVILVTAFGVYMAALPTIERSLEQQAEHRVEQEAFWATELCEQTFDVREGTFDIGRLAGIGEEAFGSRFTLVLPDGRVLFDSQREEAELDNHGSRAEILAPDRAVTRYSRTLQKELTYFASPIVVDGTLRGFSRVSVPVEDRETRLADLRAAIRNGALLAGLISLVLAGYFARRVTQPLSEIAELVTELGVKPTTRRLSVVREDEFGRLARAVNGMADDLERQIARIERGRAERDAIFSALAGGLLAVDRDRRVLFINRQGRALLGDLAGEVKGKPVSELTRNSSLIDVIDRCLANDVRAGAETSIAGEGGERTVEITAVPMASTVGAAGAGRGCVLELRDVSDLRRLEAVRRDFVSNVSHELKTPLTAMRGYTEMMLDDSEMPDSMRRSFLEKAHRNTERLAAIVRDLLSLSRLESDEDGLAFEVVDIAEQVRVVLDDLGDAAEARHTTLVLEAPEPGLQARADADALCMAISNLISNAVKYSPEHAEVRVAIARDGDRVRIDVIDRGPGIPVHAQARVFERFYRLDKARSRELGGTGLGLAIVRHVMSAHGGSVELESVLGQGSRFSLLLPLATG
jgi:two-component system phosphate regulon sensor histidine kinase PhoR